MRSTPSLPRRASRRECCRISRASRPRASDSFGISSTSWRASAIAVDARASSACRRVALVERQVDDGEHPGQAFLEQFRWRHLVGDRRVGDLAPGPHESLLHRRLRHQEGAGDVGDLQAGDGPQGQRDLGRHGERRVAAREDQPQAVVAGRLDRGVCGCLDGIGDGRLRQLRALVARPAQEVDRPVASGEREPRPGVGRHAVALPAQERRGEGVAGRVLGEGPVAGGADQAGDDPRPLRPVGPGDGVGGRGHPSKLATGRISIRPRRAIGWRDT